ncbi:hypothetical protein D1AOALGA4SA_9923 [Olavius algarvensis Delta 1 endosymbiont]|nr:hypothetical protein D1AOALGA4SA_9923 [Olavius algarvensis Delta 1 endosymbiont]
MLFVIGYSLLVNLIKGLSSKRTVYLKKPPGLVFRHNMQIDI